MWPSENHKMDGRTVVWFSCGAASAVAAKKAIEKYSNVVVVYCDTLKFEHPDNTRFLKDVEKWIGQKIEIIKSKKYNDIKEVFEARRYMSGVQGAPCTLEMKKIPRYDFQRPNDLHIFGLTANEDKRIYWFEHDNPDLELDFILQELNIDKNDCYRILKEANIKLPIMYELGFKNNNCIGCVKSGSPKYWDRVRKYFPDIFNDRAEQSRRIGCKLVVYHGKRIFLDELPEIITDKSREQNIECGVICVNEKYTTEDGWQGFKILNKNI